MALQCQQRSANTLSSQRAAPPHPLVPSRIPARGRKQLQVLANNSDNNGGLNNRVPHNTNVNAPNRFLPNLQLPDFLQPQAPQPVAALTPAVDGAFKVTGRTVVITGGSQGIGRATALLFARKGYNVVVVARDEAKLAYVVEDCARVAGRAGAALAIPCDITQERQVIEMANSVVAKYEHVDVLVNNAGVFARGTFQDTPAAEAWRLMQTNYLGAYMVTQAFLPAIVRQGQRERARGLLGGERPSIIMVSSFMGKVPTKYMGAFSASKAALDSLAVTLRAEVGGSGVHVGVVLPGLVKSNLMERSAFYGRDSEEDRKSFRQMLRALPLTQSVEEVADCIYACATSKQDEVVVGLPFAAAAQAYRLTGLNPSSVPFT